jgi:hypothetical protein
MGAFRGLGILVFVGAALLSRPATAQPATANSVQLGAGFRYGFDLTGASSNPWGLGLGIDGGYTLQNAVYLGGNLDYFFGEDGEGDGLFQLMAEVGYDLGLGENVVFRPKAGAGFAAANSEARAAVAPGAKLMLFTSSVSLSLDARYSIVFSDPSLQALILSFGIGF